VAVDRVEARVVVAPVAVANASKVAVVERWAADPAVAGKWVVAQAAA